MNRDRNPSSPLRCAAAFVDITPTDPVPLAGYFDRRAPFDGIADRLEANMVLVTDGADTLVFITFDLLYVGTQLRQELAQALGPLVAPSHLFLAASHTHFAPATDLALPKLGAVAPAYVALVVERVATAVRALWRRKRRPTELAFGQTKADHAVNRRQLVWRPARRFPFLRKTVLMRPNPAGAKDETIRVLRFGSQAVVWNYACHPVFMPTMNHVSADFVGVVRRALRRRFGPQTAVLFWQGFAGNVYPSFAAKMVGPRARLRRWLGSETRTVAAGVWQSWADSLADRVGAAAVAAIPRLLRGPMAAARTAFPMADFLKEGTTDRQVGVHQIRLGHDWHILGVSAEPAVEYAPLCRSLSHARSLFCVSCIDATVGYLPTSRMVQEGGYEAAGFLPYFELSGTFRPDVEQVASARLCPAVLDQATGARHGLQKITTDLTDGRKRGESFPQPWDP